MRHLDGHIGRFVILPQHIHAAKHTLSSEHGNMVGTELSKFSGFSAWKAVYYYIPQEMVQHPNSYTNDILEEESRRKKFDEKNNLNNKFCKLFRDARALEETKTMVLCAHSLTV